MRIPLLALSIGATGFSVSLNPLQTNGWLTEIVGEVPHTWMMSVAATIWVLLAGATAWLLYARRQVALSVNTFFENGFQLDWAYQNFFVKPAHHISTLVLTVDKKWIDGALHALVYINVGLAHLIGWVDHFIIDGTVNGLAKLSAVFGSFTRSFQAGRIQLYVFWSAAALIIFIFYLLIE
jgi:NADH-quinone oxidoreductase subunit L